MGLFRQAKGCHFRDIPEVIEKVPFSIFIDFLEPVQKVPGLRRNPLQTT